MLYYNITQFGERSRVVLKLLTQLKTHRAVLGAGLGEGRRGVMTRSASQTASSHAAGFQALSCALLLIMGLSREPALAQPFRMQSVAPSAPSLEAQQAFQASIDDQARLLARDHRFRRLSQPERQAVVELVVGNMLIAALHQLGLALLSDLSLPAIGGAEQGADDFAILTALELGKNHFSDRILMEAAKGGFTGMQRKRAAPSKSRNDQVSVRRAYRMVCLMAGADAVRFKALAEETALPRNLQRNCGWDYDRALRSWEIVLRPRRPGPDRPKTQVDVSYGVGAGDLAIYAQIFRNLRFLEAIAEVIAGQVTWRAPLLIEMRTCGASAAIWTASKRTLSICYEMAADFAHAYRGFEPVRR